MQIYIISFIMSSLIFMVFGKPPIGKQTPLLYNTPFKSSKPLMFSRSPHFKQPKTLVVQIRSDHPVPLMLKNRPHLPGNTYKHNNVLSNTPPHILGNTHSHVHHHINAAASQLKAARPIKPIGPVYVKSSQFMYKPFKLKLTNTKAKLKSQFQHRPATSYEVPFKYETASTVAYTTNVQKVPVETHPIYIADHFAPIYTVPAPNLAAQDNHINHPDNTAIEPLTSTPKPQVYHQHKTNYEVAEDFTNDQTLMDPLSGSQKLYAPDPDPSLLTAQIHPVNEQFNQPSNDKPLPLDVQSNHLPTAEPLVQIVRLESPSQKFVPHIYPIQYAQQTQPLVAAAVPIYNPTYLVTQSNNLYNQHKQQLFKPSQYANADLTQEVASDGQILQAEKDLNNNLQFAALIAAPVLDQEQTIPFRLSDTAKDSMDEKFIESHYYGNAAQDSSQLLQAYAEEDEFQRQQELQQKFLEQQQHQTQASQQHYREVQHHDEFNQLKHPPTSAFEEHERLVKQQLGPDTPLRIFVPDESETRLRKRSGDLVKGFVDDVNDAKRVGDDDQDEQNDMFEVTSSMDVSNEQDIKNSPNKAPFP